VRSSGTFINILTDGSGLVQAWKLVLITVSAFTGVEGRWIEVRARSELVAIVFESLLAFILKLAAATASQEEASLVFSDSSGDIAPKVGAR
jgi:hypothetical protein